MTDREAVIDNIITNTRAWVDEWIDELFEIIKDPIVLVKQARIEGVTIAYNLSNDEEFKNRLLEIIQAINNNEK